MAESVVGEVIVQRALVTPLWLLRRFGIGALLSRASFAGQPWSQWRIKLGRFPRDLMDGDADE